MTFFYQVRAVEVPASAVATTAIDVTGIDLGGLAPVAIRVTLIGLVDAGGGTSSVVPVRFSQGFAVSPASRVCIGGFDDHSGANTDNARRGFTSAIGIELNGAQATVGALDVASMSNADAVNLIVDDQFTVDHVAIVEAWAGSDITGAAIATWTKSVSSLTTIDVTTPGFPAKYVAVLSASLANETALGAHIPCIGRSRPGISQQGLVTLHTDNVASSDTASYCQDVESIALVNTTSSTNYRARVTANALGFSVVEDENSDGTARRYYALALGGTFQVAMGFIDTEDNLVDTINIDPGFLAKGATFLSSGKVESTSDTPSAHARVSFGAVELTSGFFYHACGAYLATDNVAAQNSMYINASGASGNVSCYANLSTAFTGVEGEMRVNNMTGNVLELAMTVADAAPRFVMWEAFGAAAAASPVTGGNFRSGYYHRALRRGRV